MKLSLALFALSLLADDNKPGAPPPPAIPDALKIEYWKARALLVEERLKQAALEAKVNAIADEIKKACPNVAIDEKGDIQCPKPEVKPPAKP